MSVDISYTKEVYKILRRQKYIKSYLHHVKDIDIGYSLLGLTGVPNKEFLVRVGDTTIQSESMIVKEH